MATAGTSATFSCGLLAVMLASMAYAQFADVENMPLMVRLPLFSVGLFVCCMVCHGELARLKPDPAASDAVLSDGLDRRRDRRRLRGT